MTELGLTPKVMTYNLLEALDQNGRTGPGNYCYGDTFCQCRRVLKLQSVQTCRDTVTCVCANL
jgi:hypothetical protein